MQITDILAQAGGLQAMARELGISEADAAKGAAALTPAILGGFKKQAQTQPAGLEGLGGLLGQLGGGNLLTQVLSPEPTDVSQGNDVLGQIFGSKDISRAVATNAASQSGLDQGVLKKMLPMLAMLIAGYMAKQGGATGGGAGLGGALTGGLPGGLGGMLGGLLGGSGGGSPAASSAGATASSASPGLSGLGSMLDMNNDGNALDDILRLAGKTFSR
jgi:hypothetical protein